MNLSKHFTLAEFTFSETASRLNIYNEPNPMLYSSLRRTAEGLEQVRTLLGDLPIRVTSAYRCDKLNTAVGSKPTSQHVHGHAVDFQCTAYGPPAKIVETIAASDIGFDQLINEFNSWVHISFVAAPRRQVLVIDRNGARPL
jgi:zinc D-Ala-D-Ala carboxypeptidase